MTFEASKFVGMDFQWTDRNITSFIKNVLICISKMNFIKKKNPYNVQNNQPSNKTTTAIILM